MSKKSSKARFVHKLVPPTRSTKKETTSLLDVMEDGKEYQSLLEYLPKGINLSIELMRAIGEIEKIRNRPLVCYFSNVFKSLKTSVSIDYSDDLPFSEMVSKVPTDAKKLDIMIVTPGGLAQQVDKFVSRLRPRFDHVSFILPQMAMSAGTLFALSGDEIWMDERAYIGPIDPQVRGRDGNFLPAQALLTLLNEIQDRGQILVSKGQNPNWTDIQILNNIDAKELGNVVNMSKYSIDLASNYLMNYKFKDWKQHSDGTDVTDQERQQRAVDVAAKLCDHGRWKSHSNGITRDLAWNECQIRVNKLEETAGLESAVRRLYALIYYFFDITNIAKIFASDQYSLIRQDAIIGGA